jgi:hypothetical protein
MKFLAIFTLSLVLLDSAIARTVEIGGNGAVVDPFSVAFDRNGDLYGVEYIRSNRVFKIDPYGVISTVAGIQAVTNQKMGDLGGNDGDNPLQAHFNGMHDLALGKDGSIYLTDTFNSRVRKLDRKTGKLTTIIGTGVAGFSGDGGPGHQAQVAQVHSLSFNADHSKLYFTDLPNRRIRVYEVETGVVRTVVGNGVKAVPSDGTPALEAPLLDPRAVLVDEDENIYIVSRGGHALRFVGPDGKIRTIINPAGTKGYSGDGGPGINATMNGPKHLAIDPAGGILITDTENHVIRRYDPKTGIITLVAGVPGVRGPASSSDPLKIELARPHGARVYKDWLYIADSENDRVIWFPYSAN